MNNVDQDKGCIYMGKEINRSLRLKHLGESWRSAILCCIRYPSTFIAKLLSQ